MNKNLVKARQFILEEQTTMSGPFRIPPLLLLLPCLLLVPGCGPPAVTAVAGRRDNISPDQPIGDGDTIVSPGKEFVLGFFGRGNSTNRYLGMWYTFSTDTVIWVANRRSPLTDTSGVLKMTSDGNLTLVHNHTNTLVWSTGTSNLKDPTATLLDNGNFVVKDGKAGRSVWQSFDHPTDTMLPGMKLGMNLRTGEKWLLRSWRTPDDPSPGTSFYVMDSKGQHEIYVRKGGNADANDIYRLGPWNGLRFSGIPRMVTYELLRFTYVSNKTDVYYTFGYTAKGTMVSRLVIHTDGTVERLGWSKQAPRWANYWTAPKDDCDSYALCGPNGICNSDNPNLCGCLESFTPKSPVSWRFKGFHMGCKRKEVGSLCGQGEGFLTVHGVKPPDTTNSSINRHMNLNDCEKNCLRNCSCTAYAAADIGSGTGCIMWYGDLIDTRTFAVDGQDLFLRVPASELAKHKRRATAVIVSVILGLGVFVLLMCGLLIWTRKRQRMRSGDETRTPGAMEESHDSSKLGDELPLFDFAAIASITNNFSAANKIGQGGFGSVYKGTMSDGLQVAVKRLSAASAQGLDEFMNEATLIAKLQHRNLVRLLGCCIQGEERMLIYEFLSNKSLDTFIFGKNERVVLNWKERVDIILGVARGLLYLHQDSRLRVIHRDLKAGNVLLDESMNPKISDFGTARLFGADQMEENTRRVIGTYGYMSPEYAMDGIFSTKSDVFSFGVLVLEIISGKKNRVFYHEQQDTNLLSLAWKLWNDGRSLELLDGALTDPASCPTSHVLRCVQIGLLCVQECAVDRPSMCSVVLMLSSDNSSLPKPRRPGFCQGRAPPFRRRRDGATSSSGNVPSSTINEVTFTIIQGR